MRHCLPVRTHFARRTSSAPTRSTVKMGVQGVHQVLEQAFFSIATKGDIGPLTNVDLETATLIAAIGGGSLVAGIIIIFIVRF